MRLVSHRERCSSSFPASFPSSRSSFRTRSAFALHALRFWISEVERYPRDPFVCPTFFYPPILFLFMGFIPIIVPFFIDSTFLEDEPIRRGIPTESARVMDPGTVRVRRNGSELAREGGRSDRSSLPRSSILRATKRWILAFRVRASSIPPSRPAYVTKRREVFGSERRHGERIVGLCLLFVHGSQKGKGRIGSFSNGVRRVKSYR